MLACDPVLEGLRESLASWVEWSRKGQSLFAMQIAINDAPFLQLLVGFVLFLPCSCLSRIRHRSHLLRLSLPLRIPSSSLSMQPSIHCALPCVLQHGQERHRENSLSTSALHSFLLISGVQDEDHTASLAFNIALGCAFNLLSHTIYCSYHYYCCCLRFF